MEIFKERANIPLQWEVYTITVVKSEAGITLWVSILYHFSKVRFSINSPS